MLVSPHTQTGILTLKGYSLKGWELQHGSNQKPQ
jgi:hypothetical protein